MIFLTIVITILPSYKVKAMTLIDNSYLPPLVQDDYTDYIIYKTKNSEIYMIKFNYSDNLVFYTSSSNSNGNFYIECKRLDDSEVNIYYNKYFFDRRYEDINDWNWLKSTSFIDTQYLRVPIGGNRYDSSVKEIQSILYSTVDMYYNPSETSTTIYSSDSNLIPGEHKHDSSLSFNEKKLEDKTYSKDNGNYEKDIIVSTIDLYQDNVSSVQTIFNFSDYYDNNYKYYIKPQGKETIDVTNEVLNGTSINGKGYVSLTFEKDVKVVALVVRNETDLGINKIFNIKVKNVSNSFESNDNKVYPDKPNDGYLDYIVYKTKDNSVFMITFNKTKNYSFFTSDTNDSGGFYIVSYLNKGGENNNTHNSYKLDNGTWKVLYQNQYLSNPIGGSKYDSSVKNIKSILYSTVDMYYLYDRTSTGSYSSDSYMIQGLHQNNMSLSLDYRRFNDKTYNKNSSINLNIKFDFITGGIVEDLDDLRDFDNNLYRKLQIDFKNYKSNYNYMVSFDDTNWFSVLSQFNVDSDENIIPKAYFNIPISTNVYAKIVDSQGNELTKNSILVELEKGFEKIGHITNNDINNLSIVEIDIENITSGFSPMRFALTYSTSSKDIKKIPNFLKYSIIGLDKNGNEFSFNIDDYYFIKQYDYSPDTYEKTQYLNIINKEYSVPDGLVRLRVKFYFDNTVDYTLDVVTTNTVSKTHVDFISSEFENYIKYVFPKDYTKAIIKPKNNNTTESNLIVLSDYFVNDNLELLNYDFINNSYDVQYNFNFTEYNDLYKYSDNEKFLNLKLIFNKENKIYPILHNNYKLVPKMSGLGSIDGSYEYKDYEQDYVEFYLPKNLYVEFVNVEELEKKVENITDEDFERDDDIDISSGFTEKMKERYFEEETQNNNFSQFFKQIYDNFSKKFIFVGQFVEIIDSFKKEIRWNGEIPSFKVNIDIPQIGLSVGEMDLIDMKYFAQYRETVHNFIKLFISIFTAIGVYRGVKGAFS